MSFSNYRVKFKVDELSFDDITYLATVINNLPDRKQHSYSEQEVISMLEALKYKILDLEILRETVNTNTIEEIDLHQFIPPKQ